MWKHEDKLTISLIALPFILVVFIVAAVLINTSRVSTNNVVTGASLVKNAQEAKSIYLSSVIKNVKKGQDFDFDVYLNTQGEELGAFAFDLKFHNENFTINTEKGSSGITKGDDANNFMIMSNPGDVSSGHFRFSGICAKNCLQGEDKYLVTVHAKAVSDLVLPGNASWLEVKELSNTLGKSLNISNYKGNIVIK